MPCSQNNPLHLLISTFRAEALPTAWQGLISGVISEVSITGIRVHRCEATGSVDNKDLNKQIQIDELQADQRDINPSPADP
jgi:hypothetical protein